MSSVIIIHTWFDASSCGINRTWHATWKIQQTKITARKLNSILTEFFRLLFSAKRCCRQCLVLAPVWDLYTLSDKKWNYLNPKQTLPASSPHHNYIWLPPNALILYHSQLSFNTKVNFPMLICCYLHMLTTSVSVICYLVSKSVFIKILRGWRYRKTRVDPLILERALLSSLPIGQDQQLICGKKAEIADATCNFSKWLYYKAPHKYRVRGTCPAQGCVFTLSPLMNLLCMQHLLF